MVFSKGFWLTLITLGLILMGAGKLWGAVFPILYFASSFIAILTKGIEGISSEVRNIMAAVYLFMILLYATIIIVYRARGDTSEPVSKAVNISDDSQNSI